jgi:hypothetical protein
MACYGDSFFFIGNDTSCYIVQCCVILGCYCCVNMATMRSILRGEYWDFRQVGGLNENGLGGTCSTDGEASDVRNIKGSSILWVAPLLRRSPRILKNYLNHC